MFPTKQEIDNTPLLGEIKCHYIDGMGGITRTTNVARVSHAKWQNEERYEPIKRDIGLFEHLRDAEIPHWSPFGHTVVCLRMTAPIFVARQWFKSTVGVVRNEESRRYIFTIPQFWMPERFHKYPTNGIKQGCSDEFGCYANDALTTRQMAVCRNLRDNYFDMLKVGMAPEEARMFLPQNTLVNWIETGSLWYYKRILGLRSEKAGAQKSGTIELAKKTYDCIRAEPNIGDALELVMKTKNQSFVEEDV